MPAADVCGWNVATGFSRRGCLETQPSELNRSGTPASEIAVVQGLDIVQADA